MEVVFHGACDLCKSDKKLLISLPKETAKALNITYGLNISNPIKWRICATCNYEICNIVMIYLEKTSSHHALLDDSSKCYICGDSRIVQGDPSLVTKINEIREISLAVPLNSATCQACFTCFHIIDTVIKYKNMLKASEISQLSIKSFQNLTKSINNAKQSTNVRQRKNPRPVKLQPQSAVKECFVKLTKLDFCTLNEIMNGSPLENSTPKLTEKREKKPIKLQQGRSWINSGLQSGLSPKAVTYANSPSNAYVTRRKSSDSPINIENVETVQRDLSESLGGNTRRTRTRKRSMHDDFIYFADNSSTNVMASKSPKKKAKPLPKLKTPNINPIKFSDMIKPCAVILERVKLPNYSNNQHFTDSNQSIDEPLEDPLNVTPTEIEISNLHEQQNENSTPNIPKMDISQHETPTKIVYTEEITEIFSSSSSTGSVSFEESRVLGRNPIKSILTPERYRNGNNVSKSVSFSDYNELIYYEPEIHSSNGNEIELADLDDHVPEQQKPHEQDDVNNLEVNSLIEEIVSQQF